MKMKRTNISVLFAGVLFVVRPVPGALEADDDAKCIEARLCRANVRREDEIACLIDVVKTSYEYRENELALHRLLELDPTGKHVLPIVARWLQGADWREVNSAKTAFLFYQESSIPHLLAIMENCKHVKLVNTADLIYPSANMFYGHGQVVDYDIEYLPVRAGWILEEIVFQDFGFRLGMITEDALHEATLRGVRDVPLTAVLQSRRANENDIAMAVERAQTWWKTAKGSWTRLRGLIEALKSENVRRQISAILYLRHSVDPCEGLEPGTFDKTIRPIVRQLADSKNQEVSEQACLLLDDNEYWWWRWKDVVFLRKELAEIAAEFGNNKTSTPEDKNNE
jgi:hypothetical protein